MANNVITKFKDFKRYVEEYIDYFGIHDWEIDVERKDDEHNEGSCQYSDVGRCATIYMSNDCTNPRKTAFHECAELFLAGVYVPIKRFRDSDTAELEVHRIIRFMENKYFG